MTQQTRLVLLLTASFMCFIGYCAALIDWVQDYQSGLYGRESVEAALETGAILLYTYIGFRFVKSGVKLP